MSYKRVLLKLSGEALIDGQSGAFSIERIQSYIADIQYAIKKGVQVALVIGGGNIIRGAELKLPALQAVTADQMGMLATVINGLLLRDAFVAAKVPVAVYAARGIDTIVPVFDRMQADADLRAGKVVICVGGTGNALFTTDSTASLRAVELGCDVILKATKVDGVYSADPVKEADATLYNTLTFDEALQQQLCVMDMTAFLHCRSHNIDIRVFNVFTPGVLRNALLGKAEGTLVSKGK